MNNTVIFHFKDGSTKTLDYKEKKKGTPHTEEYKEYMRECMKQIWDDERREKMSQKMKKLRTERVDKWQKRKVTQIPATINKYTAKPMDSKKKRKVAGYARVSTDHEDQTTSYEAQVDYYTNYIKSRDDWEFAGLYSDEGISATNTRRRDGFNRMVADALDGKIDLIITKSVSRFARNTVDLLSAIRKLKENNIECYFEKENIWTFDSKGELLLTIMS